MSGQVASVSRIDATRRKRPAVLSCVMVGAFWCPSQARSTALKMSVHAAAPGLNHSVQSAVFLTRGSPTELAQWFDLVGQSRNKYCFAHWLTMKNEQRGSGFPFAAR